MSLQAWAAQQTGKPTIQEILTQLYDLIDRETRHTRGIEISDPGTALAALRALFADAPVHVDEYIHNASPRSDNRAAFGIVGKDVELVGFNFKAIVREKEGRFVATVYYWVIPKGGNLKR